MDLEPRLFHNDGYKLVGCDLRCVDELEKMLEGVSIQWYTPTLVLAEVVLTYINPSR